MFKAGSMSWRARMSSAALVEASSSECALSPIPASTPVFSTSPWGMSVVAISGWELSRVGFPEGFRTDRRTQLWFRGRRASRRSEKCRNPQSIRERATGGYTYIYIINMWMIDGDTAAALSDEIAPGYRMRTPGNTDRLDDLILPSPGRTDARLH